MGKYKLVWREQKDCSSAMEVKDFLTMNGGDGENSYAHNSHFAMKVIARTKPYLVEAIEELLQDVVALKLFRAADLGCSCGPNAISIMATIIGTVKEIHRRADKKPPEIQYLLNDLPSNDFNSLFRDLSSRQAADSKEGELSCCMMGVPGSFYGRLFPSNDLHFVHSSYSAHWLSQVPAEIAVNKGHIYISKTSPPCVWKAYLKQFEKDFSALLKCRYEEMVVNGRLVLIFHGRPNADAMEDKVYPWHFISKALSELVTQGQLEEEKLDEWNIPYYTASKEDVKQIVKREGSFSIQKLETLKLKCGEESETNLWVKAQRQAKNVRCYTESLIVQQFGENIAKLVFDRLPTLLFEELTNEETSATSLIIVLKKK